ncbi:MAG: hypothetical protein GY913_35505, partial [Proteobacteria bacterium]|nr:hypothetical protein [Pseudomonadota bacterium]
MLLLTLACAQRTWTPEVKTKGKPEIVAVHPRYLLEASVEDAGFDEIAVRVHVTEQALDQVTQSYRHAQVGRYSTESAVEAGNTWMATGGVTGFLGLVGGGYALSEGDNADGEPIFNWGAGLGGFVILGAPILIAGSFQYATPLLPARRKDRRVESRSTIQDGKKSPWIGTVLVTTMGGEVIDQGSTGEDGSTRLVFAVPDVDRVQVRLEGPAGRQDLDLTGTEAWFDVRAAEVRRLAATADVADLQTANDIAERAGSGETEMWTDYCEGFAEGWSGEHLERRSEQFEGLGDVPACTEIWEDLDSAWAQRLAKGAERGEADWDAELPNMVARHRDKTPALRGLTTCVQLQSEEEPYFVAGAAAAELAAPAFHTATCFQGVLAEAEAEIARIEAAEAAAERKCDQAKRAVANEMPRLTSTAYADTAAYGIRNTRDALVMKMNRMVAYGGPSYDEQEWVQCVTYALGDADDMIRGIYQMN